jgi:hypothetical protein
MKSGGRQQKRKRCVFEALPLRTVPTTQQGKSIDQAIEFAQSELEGFIRT